MVVMKIPCHWCFKIFQSDWPLISGEGIAGHNLFGKTNKYTGFQIYGPGWDEGPVPKTQTYPVGHSKYLCIGICSETYSE